MGFDPPTPRPHVSDRTMMQSIIESPIICDSDEKAVDLWLPSMRNETIEEHLFSQDLLVILTSMTRHQCDNFS